MCACPSTGTGPSPQGGQRRDFVSGDGGAVEQDVSMSLGAGSGGHCGLVCPVAWVPEPLHLWGASRDLLVLRIAAHKIIRVSHVWGSSQLRERRPEKVAFCLIYYLQ